MKKPLQAGDVCKVIDGVFGASSPNIGKLVTVQSLQGQHSNLGNVWRCTGEGLVRFDDSDGVNWADIPAVWLHKQEGPNDSDMNQVHEGSAKGFSANDAQTLTSGSVVYYNDDGQQVVVAPNDLHYPVAAFYSYACWDGTAWVKYTTTPL